MCALGRGHQWVLALQLFEQMQDVNIEADVVIYSTLIDAYAKSVQLQRATQLLDRMIQHGPAPNEISFNSTIGACAQGQWLEAISLLSKMQQQGLAPVTATCRTALRVCCTKDQTWHMKNKLDSMKQANGSIPEATPARCSTDPPEQGKRGKKTSGALIRFSEIWDKQTTWQGIALLVFDNVPCLENLSCAVHSSMRLRRTIMRHKWYKEDIYFACLFNICDFVCIDLLGI
jgi:pentatricopeptide repeat protein